MIVAIIASTPLGAKAASFLRRRAKEGGAAFAVWSVFEVVHPVLLLFLSATALAGNSYNPFLYFIF